MAETDGDSEFSKILFFFLKRRGSQKEVILVDFFVDRTGDPVGEI